MRIRGIVWFEEVIEKLARKHSVSVIEVEDVLARSPQLRFIEGGNYRDEDVYAALGQTRAGRYLVIFFVYKQNNQALILSARDMDKKERKRYGKN